MTSRQASGKPDTSLTQDVLQAARYYLGRRRGLFIVAGFLLSAGIALNWSWLVAAGIAPLLIGALPCVAMCALGLCMNRAGGKSCSTGPIVRQSAGAETGDPAPDLQVAAPEMSAISHDGQSPISAADPVATAEPIPLNRRSTTDA